MGCASTKDLSHNFPVDKHSETFSCCEFTADPLTDDCGSSRGQKVDEEVIELISVLEFDETFFRPLIFLGSQFPFVFVWLIDHSSHPRYKTTGFVNFGH